MTIDCDTHTHPSSHTHTHTHILTMVSKACSSCCCCRSRPQATHSPWQSLRPGVKRQASNTSRYHRGIFMAQYSNTGGEGGGGLKGAEQGSGDESETRVTSWITGRQRRQEQGPAYREKAARIIETLRQCQIHGVY